MKLTDEALLGDFTGLRVIGSRYSRDTFRKRSDPHWLFNVNGSATRSSPISRAVTA